MGFEPTKQTDEGIVCALPLSYIPEVAGITRPARVYEGKVYEEVGLFILQNIRSSTNPNQLIHPDRCQRRVRQMSTLTLRSS